MIYIQLSEAIKGFNMIRIKEFHFFDTDDLESTPPSISFKYQCCYKNGDKYIELYNKHISISKNEDGSIYDRLLKNSSSNISAQDEINRVLLEYLVSNKIETGTIEVIK